MPVRSTAALLAFALPVVTALATDSLLSRTLAQAQPDTQQQDADPSGANPYLQAPGAGNDNWTVQFEPTAWFAAPGGEIDVPGLSVTSLDFDDFNIDSAAIRPAGELQFRRGRWSVLLGAFHVEEEGDSTLSSAFTLAGTPFAAGDAIAADFKFTSLRALAGYRIHAFEGVRLDNGRLGFTSDLDLVGGLRIMNLKLDLDATSTSPLTTTASTSLSELYAQPVIGARWSMGIIEEFTVDSELTLGYFTAGDQTSFSVDILLGFAWEPSPYFGAQFGYRQLAYILETDGGSPSLDYQGAIAGLYVGVKLRF